MTTPILSAAEHRIIGNRLAAAIVAAHYVLARCGTANDVETTARRVSKHLAALNAALDDDVICAGLELIVTDIAGLDLIEMPDTALETVEMSGDIGRRSVAGMKLSRQQRLWR